MTDDLEDDGTPIKLPTFAELRAILANRPPGEEGAEVLDAALDLFAEDLAQRWPKRLRGSRSPTPPGWLARRSR